MSKKQSFKLFDALELQERVGALEQRVVTLERQHLAILGDMQRLVNEVNAQLTLRSVQPEPQLLIPHQGPAA